MWQKLFKNAKKADRRQPKQTQLNLERLEGRIVPAASYSAVLSPAGTLAVTEVGPFGPGTVSITETAGVIAVSGPTTGAGATKINGVYAPADFTASAVATITVGQGASNENLTVNVTNVSLPGAGGVVITFGKGADTVVSTGNTLNELKVAAPSTGGVNSVTSIGDKLGELLVTESNATGDSVSVMSLTASALVDVTQGSGKLDTISVVGASGGVSQTYTQGKGSGDSLVLSDITTTKLVATQGDGKTDDLSVSTVTAQAAVLTQGKGDMDTMEVTGANLTSEFVTSVFTQGAGHGDQMTMTGITANSVEITQPGGDAFINLSDSMFNGNDILSAGLTYTGGYNSLFQVSGVNAPGGGLITADSVIDDGTSTGLVYL